MRTHQRFFLIERKNMKSYSWIERSYHERLLKEKKIQSNYNRIFSYLSVIIGITQSIIMVYIGLYCIKWIFSFHLPTFNIGILSIALVLSNIAKCIIPRKRE